MRPLATKSTEFEDADPSQYEIETHIAELARRLRVGIKRKQVALGKERLFRLLKNSMVSLVWVTEDLSKKSFMKLRIQCRDHQVPVLRFGQSQEIGMFTGKPSTKVYLIKKSFSGIQHVLRELDDIIEEPLK